MSMLGVAQKAPEAFRTISEVAAELDLPQHVLRFWETKFVALKPLKRGGGRRYYRPDDVDLLRGIRALLYRDGLTIKGVQKILKEQGPRYVMELGRGLASLVVPMPLSAPVPSGAVSDVPFAPASNVHPFPREIEPPRDAAQDFVRDEGRVVNELERERFEALLEELAELKARLMSARRKPLDL